MWELVPLKPSKEGEESCTLRRGITGEDKARFLCHERKVSIVLTMLFSCAKARRRKLALTMRSVAYVPSSSSFAFIEFKFPQIAMVESPYWAR